jgi:hypothetical protein
MSILSRRKTLRTLGGDPFPPQIIGAFATAIIAIAIASLAFLH